MITSLGMRPTTHIKSTFNPVPTLILPNLTSVYLLIHLQAQKIVVLNKEGQAGLGEGGIY